MGGGDKGLLPFAGGTLLGAVIARLAPQVGAQVAPNFAPQAGAQAGAQFGAQVAPQPGAQVAPQPGAQVGAQVGALALNVHSDAGQFASFGLPLLADAVPGQPGPLAGILAAMDWAAAHGAARVVTVPCDTPFLPADLVARLSAAAPVGAAIAATAGGDVHPVVGLWPVSLAPALRARLATGDRRVGAFAAAVGAVTVAFPPGPPDPFLNLNTPDDLAQAALWS